MPHQCVRCNSMYPNGAKEILTGCSCGARLFFYIKQKNLEEGKELVGKLSKEEKKNIEKDIVEIINISGIQYVTHSLKNFDFNQSKTCINNKAR